MKIYIWVMMLSAVPPVLSEGCDVKMTDGNQEKPMEFDSFPNVNLWFKPLDEASMANVTAIGYGGKNESEFLTLSADKVDTWGILFLRKHKADGQEYQPNAKVDSDAFRNGHYFDFERVTSVNVSSNGSIIWSTCEIGKYPINAEPYIQPHYEDHSGLIVIVVLFGLLLVLVIIVLAFALCKTRRTCRAMHIQRATQERRAQVAQAQPVAEPRVTYGPATEDVQGYMMPTGRPSVPTAAQEEHEYEEISVDEPIYHDPRELLKKKKKKTKETAE